MRHVLIFVSFSGSFIIFQTTMTTRAITKQFENVFNRLSEIGFLLESDPKLPNVCGIITGERMRGSWWSHPRAQTIFQVNEQLADHPDVMATKLVSGKVTFVHRSRWPEVLAIGTAVEDWQIKDLSPAAEWLLKEINKKGSWRTDQIELTKFAAKTSDVARELERKLLVHAGQIHTESGAHAKILESWKHWTSRASFDVPVIQFEEAKRRFEKQLSELNAKYRGRATLPWKAIH
jgi:hypothetical protein